MNRKAAKRIEPFFLLKEEQLEVEVKNLSPSDLGEITNLMRLHRIEANERLAQVKERLEKEGCREPAKSANLDYLSSKVEIADRLTKTFEKRMLDRRSERYLYITRQ